ncbi:MAG: cysteine--tRNA ligase, partial [Cyclobacteriaceae bacterium]|nr:cysteine--tRNA ligase [Cyclobacteriaceae bacterium]
YKAMNDDFNTALTIGHLFNLLKKVNSIQTQNLTSAEIGKDTFDRMKTTFISFIVDALGLKEENNINSQGLLDVIIGIYGQAKEDIDYVRVDEIRNQLKEQGIVLKDMKTGIDWAYEE